MKNKNKKLLKSVVWVLSIVVAILILYTLLACLVYPPEYVYRALTWGKESVHDYRKFPERALEAAGNPFYFGENLQEARVRAIFEADPQIEDLEKFLIDTDTQAFIVIQDDQILYENYFNGSQRDSIVTSFSVAKSFTSALIGIAIADGHIHNVNDPITDYLPELLARDSRFGDITIRDLLMMSSGIRYFEDIPLLNDDGTKTYIYPDLRELALTHSRITEQPGEHFLYNNYHPLLLGMSLERTTRKPVTEYLQQKIWQPLGMEFDGSWSLDSEESGFEKMESGINARAIDFAKFGRLFLHNGNWNGVQVIPAEWIAESTQADTSVDYVNYYYDDFIFSNRQGYYKYMWWGIQRDARTYDFIALGNLGQYIYISPQKNLIILRFGESCGEFGDSQGWLDLFYGFTSNLDE